MDRTVTAVQLEFQQQMSENWAVSILWWMAWHGRRLKRWQPDYWSEPITDEQYVATSHHHFLHHHCVLHFKKPLHSDWCRQLTCLFSVSSGVLAPSSSEVSVSDIFAPKFCNGFASQCAALPPHSRRPRTAACQNAGRHFSGQQIRFFVSRGTGGFH